MKRSTLTILCCSLTFASHAGTDSLSNEIDSLNQQVQQLQNEWHNGVVVSNPTTPLSTVSATNLNYAVLQAQHEYPAPLTLGGFFEADLQTWNGDHIRGVIGRNRYPDNGTVFAPTSANLYALANLNSWTQTYLMIEGGLNGYQTLVSDAFVNFGNLQKSPVYASFGKTTLPFGTFPGNGLVASTLDNNAFASTELAQADFGYAKGNLNTSLALFNGQNNLSDFAYSVQYGTTINRSTLQIGAGYLNDVRYTGSGLAAAYGTSSGTRNQPFHILQNDRAGAVDLNASLTYNMNAQQYFNLAGEWDTTTSSPTILDHAPGKMQAWTASGSYTTPIMNKSTTFALDYSATIHMHEVPLSLPAPINTETPVAVGIKNQWLTYAQTEVTQNIYLGPEVAILKLYNGDHMWESSLDLSMYF